MKGLFIFDQAISQDCNGYIYDAIFTDAVFSRYLNHVEELTILVRLRPADMKIIEERHIPKIDTSRIRVKEVPNLLSVKGLFQYFAARKIVKEEVEKSDIIFVREPSVLESIVSYYARKKNKKYVLEIGGCPWDTFWNQGIKGKIIAPIRYLSTRISTLQAKYVVYVTNQWLQKRYPTKGEWVACSNVDIKCDVKAYENRINKIHLDMKNDKQEFIIGSIGDYAVRSKGHKYVIMALKELNNNSEGIVYKYQIVGSGDKSESLNIAKKWKVEHYVEFIPPMNHAAILEWLDSLDFYAQPSRQEGLPRSVIEAMSRGLAIIGAKTGGIPELIREDCVFSNKKSEVTEIVNIIRSIDYKKMLELAEENFKNAIQYNSDVIEMRRYNFFKKIISEHRS